MTPPARPLIGAAATKAFRSKDNPIPHLFKLRVLPAAFLLLIALALAPAVLHAQDIEKAEFFREGLAPVRKDRGYDLTIVYFMDYQCPACRQYTPDVARAFAEDRRLRIIYRDTPIFGPRSEAAARAAIASQFQGRHEAFHHALMTQKMPLDDAAIRAAAKKAGVDWARLQSDLARRRDDIERQIVDNMALSEAASLSGTPAFIVGDQLTDGALSYAELKRQIADERKLLARPAAAAPQPQPQPVEEPKPQAPQAKTASEAPAAGAAPPDFRRSAAPPVREEPAAAPPGRFRTPLLAGLAGLLLLGLAVLGYRLNARRSRH